MVKCPTCSMPWPMKEVVWNMFVGGSTPGSQAEEKRQCTSCEENVAAVSFCTDCSEWLCEPCVQAHKRVRVTKDHTVVQKENTTEVAGKRTQFCPKHRNEQLKLFCDTCDQLTCRDCQLEAHKDHKYSFLVEAADSFRYLLNTYLDKIREKKGHIEQARLLIDKRYNDIRAREQAIVSEVKLFQAQLVSEVNKRCVQLVTDLSSVCNTKKSQLMSKKSEIEELAKKVDYGMAFAEFAKTTTNANALLYSKRVLSSQLKLILKTRCEVPNPNHVLDIQFKYNAEFTNLIGRQGMILVDGIPFHFAGRNNGTGFGGITAATFAQMTPEQKANVVMRMRQMQQIKNSSSAATGNSNASFNTLNRFLPPSVRQTVAHVSPLQSATSGDRQRMTSPNAPSSSSMISLSILQQQRDLVSFPP